MTWLRYCAGAAIAAVNGTRQNVRQKMYYDYILGLKIKENIFRGQRHEALNFRNQDGLTPVSHLQVKTEVCGTLRF